MLPQDSKFLQGDAYGTPWPNKPTHHAHVHLKYFVPGMIPGITIPYQMLLLLLLLLLRAEIGGSSSKMPAPARYDTRQR